MIRALAMVGAAMAMGMASAAGTDPISPALRLPLMPTPTIDGKIGAEEWKAAPSMKGFCKYRKADLLPADATFWVGRDATRLYFAAKCILSPEGLHRKVAPRKGNAPCYYPDDTFEMVFTEDLDAGGKLNMRHLTINANGAFHADAVMAGARASWNPSGKVTCATTVEDGYWYYELAIDLAEIGFDGKHVHGFRVCRNWIGGGNGVYPEQTMWTCQDNGFFGAAGAPQIVFDDAAPVVQLVKCGGGEDDHVYPVALSVYNPGKKASKIDISVKGAPVNSQPLSINEKLTLRSGDTKLIEKGGAVLNDERVTLDITVKADGNVCYYRRTAFQPNGPALVFETSGAKKAAVGLHFAFYPSFNRGRINVDAASMKDRTDAKFEIIDDAGKTLYTHPLAFNAEGVCDEILDLPDLKAATLASGNSKYVARATVGKEKDEIAFTRNVFDWEGNKIGLSDAVVPPFEKVRREKVKVEVEKRGGEKRWTADGQVFDCEDVEKVGVVLRDHYVDKKTGLWQQVIAAGKPLLARPMRWVEVKSKKEKGISEDGNSAVQPSTFNLQPPASTSNLQPSISSSWDYDGCCDIKLTLAPGHYEPMALEIPLRGERARLYHACADTLRTNPAGAIPAGVGKVWDSSKVTRVALIGDYIPYLWVGGALRGIAIFGDNDRGWVVGEEVKSNKEEGISKVDNSTVQPSTSNLQPPTPCTEIIREPDGTVVIRLNFIQRAVDIKEPQTIHFGMQVTPVKPMLENWRGRTRGLLMAGSYIWGDGGEAIRPWDNTDTYFKKMAEARKTGVADYEFAQKFTDDYPYIWPKDSPKYKAKYQLLQVHYRAGLSWSVRAHNAEPGSPESKLIFYTNGRGIGYNYPDGDTFADEWCRQPWTSRPFNFESGHAYDLDPGKSYADMQIMWYKAMVETGAADGIYWDDVFPSGNFDVGVTDAYRPEGGNGDIQPSCGVFNMRNLVRRCAVMMVELGKDPRDNWVHMTNTSMAPISAFAGVHYDWEDSSGERAIQEMYSREYIEAVSTGRQMGCRVGVMGYFAGTDRTTDKHLQWQERTGTGVCLAYELEWIRVPLWVELHGKLRAWGYRQPTTQVWNYFDEDVPFPVLVTGGTNAALAMSKKGAAIVIVSDFEKGGDYTIRPDCKTLGIPAGFKAYNFETGAELPVKDGVVSVSLDKFDFAIVELK